MLSLKFRNGSEFHFDLLLVALLIGVLSTSGTTWLIFVALVTVRMSLGDMATRIADALKDTP